MNLHLGVSYMTKTVTVVKKKLFLDKQWGSKIRPFKIWIASRSDFKLFLTKWQPFVQILNGLAHGFEIPFKVWTICKPNLSSTI